MSLNLVDLEQEVKRLVAFVQQTYVLAQKKTGVIAVSGGIDSAVAVTLLTRALGVEYVMPIMLPYGEQELEDGEEILRWNQIPEKTWQVINIKEVVDVAAGKLGLDASGDVSGNGAAGKVRLGNLMARVRMMVVYDLAKKHDALVCGTENKSEKYLGYFTRFGDEASDIEPLVGLYKTQVRELAEWLDLPGRFLEKKPSAGLWVGQTDEVELGFSYSVADRVLAQLIDEKKELSEITVAGVAAEVVQRVLARVKAMEFKQRVPYVAR
jgi:NAD+ synthase